MAPYSQPQLQLSDLKQGVLGVQHACGDLQAVLATIMDDAAALGRLQQHGIADGMALLATIQQEVMAASEQLQHIVTPPPPSNDKALVEVSGSLGSPPPERPQTAAEARAQNVAVPGLLRDNRGARIRDEAELRSALNSGDAMRISACMERKEFCGWNAKHKNGWSALHYAITRRYNRWCASLLACEDFVELDAEDEHGRTALHCAAELGMLDTSLALVARPDFMNVNAIDRRTGRTALHIAAHHDLAPVCAALLARDDFITVNHKDVGLWTALHFGASAGHAAVCQALIDGAPQLNLIAVNGGGRTAEALAEARGQAGIAELLHEREKQQKKAKRKPATAVAVVAANRVSSQ
jgi:hypothetical protein